MKTVAPIGAPPLINSRAIHNARLLVPAVYGLLSYVLSLLLTGFSSRVVITSSITVILSFMILNVVLPSVFNVLSFDRTSDCVRKAFVVSLSSLGTALHLMNCGWLLFLSVDRAMEKGCCSVPQP